MKRLEEGPIGEFVSGYSRGKMARFHMPGHKGAAVGEPFDGVTPYDITEITGADSLYRAGGIISRSERDWARLAGARLALYSTGGATLCVQAMLALFAKPGGKVIADRMIHQSAVNAMALLGLTPVWLARRTGGAGFATPVDAAQLERALAEHPDASCVYVTSPDYFGALADIGALARVCGAAGKPLLADNAHGAHLMFAQPSRHPIALGADACCDSLHKTLPVLTGGAVLYVNPPHISAEDAKRAMSLFGSTSPSYLTMLSMERAYGYIASGGDERYRECFSAVSRLAELAESRGFGLPQPPRDPLKLAVGFAQEQERDFAAHLRAHNIEPEMIVPGCCVFMPSPFNTPEEMDMLRAALETFEPEPYSAEGCEHVLPEMAMPPREAVFAPREVVPAQNSGERISAGIAAPCPPGIPIVMPGEIIEKNLIRIFKKYGINDIPVIK